MSAGSCFLWNMNALIYYFQILTVEFSWPEICCMNFYDFASKFLGYFYDISIFETF